MEVSVQLVVVVLVGIGGIALVLAGQPDAALTCFGILAGVGFGYAAGVHRVSKVS